MINQSLCKLNLLNEKIHLSIYHLSDTFLYRFVNMALRTKNMVIIWKFRFIIQDIYQQLKNMYEKQKNKAIGMC